MSKAKTTTGDLAADADELMRAIVARALGRPAERQPPPPQAESEQALPEEEDSATLSLDDQLAVMDRLTRYLAIKHRIDPDDGPKSELERMRSKMK